jgi:hypothetical protein
MARKGQHHPGKRGARGPEAGKGTHPVKGRKLPVDGHAQRRPGGTMKSAQSDTAPMSRAAGRRDRRLEKMEL